MIFQRECCKYYDLERKVHSLNQLFRLCTMKSAPNLLVLVCLVLALFAGQSNAVYLRSNRVLAQSGLVESNVPFAENLEKRERIIDQALNDISGISPKVKEAIKAKKKAVLAELEKAVQKKDGISESSKRILAPQIDLATWVEPSEVKKAIKEKKKALLEELEKVVEREKEIEETNPKMERDGPHKQEEEEQEEDGSTEEKWSRVTNKADYAV